MPANLSNPFGESCCDGGGTSTYESAQPCGCDLGLKGGPHYCEQHTQVEVVEAELVSEEEDDRYTNLQRRYMNVVENNVALKTQVRRLLKAMDESPYADIVNLIKELL